MKKGLVIVKNKIMANTYLLLIDQIYVQPVQNIDEDSELINVITKIDWRYEATSETGTITNFTGVKMMGSPNPESFVNYNDVTYEMAQDWCRLSEDEELRVYEVLDNQINNIEKQKFLKPDVMPWEVLPPGEEEINAQNTETEE